MGGGGGYDENWKLSNVSILYHINLFKNRFSRTTPSPTTLKYRWHSKECMWHQRGHFYMVFNVYDSKVTRGKGEAHVTLY